MGVASEVLEHVRGAAEGRRYTPPIRPGRPAADMSEGLRVTKRGQGAGESKLALSKGSAQLREEESTKQAREHAHGKEEVRSTGDPAGMIGGRATAGHDAVHVGMV